MVLPPYGRPVDLDHGMEEVVEIVAEVSGYLHFGPPKTRAGYRRVGLTRAVALWIAAGANPKEVAARAGHTSVSFTLDRYGHLYPDTVQALRDRLDALHAVSQARQS